ncbi:hypothetical protein [Pseudovibrio sp. Tun.PSC04-5.I4]|uniref:hypothetical protein n=1 Tax=Pseudovibrio sp. Tun.PSC04-5.I4 TaxID=1798213 RepID=UPI00088CB357|nr:hypothetical protein [Pseudovibrio sp. Tun.PSC04-5.I4]SDR07308.1 hypothetical protein SAMN04515695_2612 [Pseudovibrio sp. Tun.PSC04-5.I4]
MIFKKLAIAALIALTLGGCAKTIKLSDVDTKKITKSSVKPLKNRHVREGHINTHGIQHGLLGVVVTTAMNAASGAYSEMAAIPAAKYDPQTAMRTRLTKYLQRTRKFHFKGTIRGPYSKTTINEEKRAAALTKLAKETGYSGYYLDISTVSYQSEMKGAGWFATVNHKYQGRALLVSAKNGKILAASTCFIIQNSDLSELAKSGQKNVDLVAKELGNSCAEQIIQSIF